MEPAACSSLWTLYKINRLSRASCAELITSPTHVSSLSTSQRPTHTYTHIHTRRDATLPLVCDEPVRTTNTQNTKLISNFISFAAFTLHITMGKNKKAPERALRGGSAFLALRLFPLRDLTGHIISAKNILRESGRREAGVGLHGRLRAGGGWSTKDALLF